MEYIREQIISADIPGQPPGTYVIYKIKATEIEEYSFEFDGSSLSSGMFFYILSAQENILTRKCCYLK